MAPGREFGARHRIIDGVVEADVDAPDGVGKQHEAQKAHLSVVVDVDISELVHRRNETSAASLRALLLHLFLGVGRGVSCGFSLRVFLLQLLHLVCFVQRKDGVYFRVSEVLVVDVRVARNGYCRGARAIVGDADHHDGVGVFFALIHTGMQVRQLLFGERIPLGIGARVLAHEQDIDRAIEAVVLKASLVAQRQVGGGGDVISQLAHGEVAHAGEHEDHCGQEGDDGLEWRRSSLGGGRGLRGRGLNVAGGARGIRGSHGTSLSELAAKP